MPNIKKGKNGKFVSHAKRVEKTCENCGKVFLVKESSLKYGRGRCCSRKCVDENKKKNIGDKNPMFGTKQSQERKEQTSARIKQMWNDPSFRKHLDNKREEYVDKNGHAWGASPESVKRRKQTMLDRYGVEHTFQVLKFRRKAEETCLKLYGKHSWEIATEYLKDRETLIEIKIRNILSESGISFIPYYKIYTDMEHYKEYDFYLPKQNLLIEADGDYWHANPKIYSDKNSLNETQIKNKSNDEEKNILAEKKKIRLLRFWESDIVKSDFRSHLLEQIKTT